MYYVLINSTKPCFLSDDEGEPQSYMRGDQARDDAAKNALCRAYGFTLIDWHEGEGIRYQCT